MRWISILLIGAALAAAEPEQLTMKDGRVLAGIVTPSGLHAATVSLMGPVPALITISLDDVVRREPYTAPPDPEPRPVVAPPVRERIPADPTLFELRRSRTDACDEHGGCWASELAVERAL